MGATTASRELFAVPDELRPPTRAWFTDWVESQADAALARAARYRVAGVDPSDVATIEREGDVLAALVYLLREGKTPMLHAWLFDEDRPSWEALDEAADAHEERAAACEPGDEEDARARMRRAARVRAQASQLRVAAIDRALCPRTAR